jgi:nitroreductase
MNRLGIIVLMIALCLSVFGCVSGETSSKTQTSAVLFSRTTLHNSFSPAPLDDTVTRLLISAGFSAPTGGGQRSIEFFVVTDRNIMKGIQQGHPYSSALDTAPLIIVIAANNNAARYPELHEMDSGLAAMAMIVQATELDLSTCVLSISPQEERVSSAMTALSMPEYYTPVLMVAFGHPGADATSGASVDTFNGAQVFINGYSAANSVNVVTSATIR